mmetsp:Transcript_5475/g.14542  ORF Transcript_5475/g.14542 Transcript_5475/m.14542 type:complete len:114 (-) Transcript_5475:54-395(-)
MALTANDASTALATTGGSLEDCLKGVAASRRRGLDLGALLLPYNPEPKALEPPPEYRAAYKDNNKYYIWTPENEYEPEKVKEVIITKPMRNQYTREGQCGNWKTGQSSWRRGF